MSMPRIILASQSPRRAEIMRTVLPEGATMEVIPVNLDEKAIGGERRASLAAYLTAKIALAKNHAMSKVFSGPTVVVTADTMVTCNGLLYEKPRDNPEAWSMLESYGDHPATVVTSVVVSNVFYAREAMVTDTATVKFKPFSPEEIMAILNDGTVFGAAGGFIIEHPLFTEKVESITGDPDTVQGLPGRLVKVMLRDAIKPGR